MAEAILRLEGITKSFASNKVLDGVSLELERGRCYAVVGENGAGKSTLMKIIAGIYRPDAGRIFLEGEQVRFHSTGDAIRRGISVIHQELSLAGGLSVAHNIFCNREFTNRLGFVDWARMHAEARKVFDAMGVPIDPSSRVDRISIGMQQIVEIGKALSLRSKILIMDEPTSALSEKEVDHLYEIVAGLQGRGVTVVFISHKLAEVFRIAERIIVLRDGVLVGNAAREDIGREEVVRLMVGRRMADLYPSRRQQMDPPFSRREASGARACSRASPSSCARVRCSASPDWWARGGPRSPGRSSEPTRWTGARCSSAEGSFASGGPRTPSARGSATSPRTARTRGSSSR